MGLAFRFGLLGLVGAHDRVAILSMIRRDGGRGGGAEAGGSFCSSGLLRGLCLCSCTRDWWFGALGLASSGLGFSNSPTETTIITILLPTATCDCKSK